MRKIALIVAGGRGLRMGAEVPKQFIALAGKPVLMWTTECFTKFDPEVELVLVLPADQFEVWKALCQEYNFKLPVRLVEGGATRFQSVKNGLDSISGEGIVFIHDGVRPLVSKATLENCFNSAMEQGNALPVFSVVESLRKVTTSGSQHIDRNQFRLVQTPQTFVVSGIQKAYQQPESDFFTDDASVYEAAGNTICLVDGNQENIKITTPVDLKIAEMFLKTEC
ncbi:2-C-methyl-D-erythritol 4-phosphate cytidylyltransferase [Sunxiuqinia elliptica]|uniref:2-C-methyl-D-erythritol 4-phosphate cytidylyltransferase n=1 Tax=Sunxiuqinia elliptica TaxID=655355 RepID=A0A1I2ANY3_9BACT|nr:2-C-methyl-D-erythritol 4-phosphate cytidylyltransferase [Sunxiuqinia elliptica]SFE45268.1 2-C-methyl-D-erythritol 4-phosphate cytidylyltransferase [Sunxiuqinia elliptica]